jgi:hypothetical protein
MTEDYVEFVEDPDGDELLFFPDDEEMEDIAFLIELED